MKVVISGASGLVGKALTQHLNTWGYQVVPLVRNNFEFEGHGPAIYWDPESGVLDPTAMEGIHAVINLSGDNIASGRWTKVKKKKILESRVKSTLLLSRVLSSLKHPPKLWISASAVGFYGNTGNSIVDEESPPGTDFLANVCQAWEDATIAAQRKAIRVIHARLGMVLSDQGGALKTMLTPFKMGVGGVIGSGDQWVSWVDIDDVVGAIHYLMEKESIEGAVNIVAPEPVTNRELTKTLGALLHRPTVLPMPAPLARLVFGEMADALLLSSCRAIPKRLLEAGYQFKYGTLKQSLGRATSCR